MSLFFVVERPILCRQFQLCHLHSTLYLVWNNNHLSSQELSSLNRKGSKIGTVTVKYEDKELDSFEAKLDEEIVFSLDKYLANYKVYIIIFIFVVCVTFTALMVRAKYKKMA